jgi:hemerythrin
MKWDSKYKINVPSIDEEHKMLFTKIASILDAHSKNQITVTLLTNLLNDLNDYVKYHFEHEEDLMKEINYPKYEQHIMIHRHMENIVKTKFDEIQTQYETFDIPQFAEFVGQWLIYHIAEQDQQIAKFIKDKKIKI